MLIIALVLAVIGLAALVAAVVTSNELIAWVCIGASAIGVLLLIADALRSRRGGDASAEADADADADAEVADANDDGVQDYPEEPANDPSTPADAEPTDAEPTDAEPADGVPTDAEPTDGVSADAEPTDSAPADAEPEPDVAGVTDTEGESEPGGAVEISPDPEKTPEKN